MNLLVDGIARYLAGVSAATLPEVARALARRDHDVRVALRSHPERFECEQSGIRGRGHRTLWRLRTRAEVEPAA